MVVKMIKLKKLFAMEKSLKSVLFLLFFMTGFLSLSIFGLFSMAQFSKTLIEERGNARIDVLVQIGERISAIAKRAETISNLYYYDSELYKQIGYAIEEGNTENLIKYLDDLDRQYSLSFESEDFSYSVAVDLENGFQYYSDDNSSYDFSVPKKKLWYNKLLQSNGNIFWTKMYKVGPDSHAVQAASRLILDKNKENVIGTLFVVISEDVIAKTYESILGEENNVYIINEEGSIISHSDKNMVGINFYNMERFNDLFGPSSYAVVEKEGESLFLINYYDLVMNYTIVEETPVSVIMNPLKVVRRMVLLAFILCVMITFILSLNFSEFVVNPLNRLLEAMRKMQKGDLKVRSEESGWKEIKELGKGFNGMVEKFQSLIDEVKVEQEQKRKAELNFLQAQINPHFIYNTLFSIKCMASMHRDEDVEKMLYAFSKHLEGALNISKEMVLFSTEIETLKEYVNLLKYRYGNGFDVIFNIDSSTENCLIPRMLLQPLVENAVFHGLEPKGGIGTIIINAYTQDGDLITEVIDDGVGMTEEQVKNIFNLSQTFGDKGHHIGLNNINERIKLYFGEGYCLTVEGEADVGVKVIIRIPFREMQEDLVVE